MDHEPTIPGTASRVVVLAYGVVAYVIAFSSILYAMGFVADLAVPKTIDGGASEGTSAALLVNLAVLSVFAVQHSRRPTRTRPASTGVCPHLLKLFRD